VRRLHWPDVISEVNGDTSPHSGTRLQHVIRGLIYRRLPTPTDDGKVALLNAPIVPSTTGRWGLVALLVSGMTFCYAQRGTLSVAAPFMIRDLGINTETMGFMLSAFSWCYCFMQVPAGWIVDRFGVRRAYACGFALWSIACTLTGAFRNIGAIVVFRITMGVGQSVAFPASARTVANWFPDTERGLVNSSYLTGVRLGQALINAAGVGLISVYGWRMLFVVCGLAPLLWIVPWMLVLRRWETPRAAVAAPSVSNRFSFATSFGLLRHPTVLGTFLGFFAYDYVWFVFVFWLPGYLRLERHFTPAQMAFHSSVPFLVMSIVIVLSGIATDRLIASGFRELRVRKTFIAIGFAIAMAIVPAGLVHDNDTSVWLLSISLCGLGLAAPNTWSLTQACCTKRLVGTVSGLQNFGGNVGGIIAPWLTGAIAHRTGSFASAFVVCGFILAGGALAYWLLMNDMVRSPEEAAQA
jgi:ACS family D-galactonate transporter-like MFS transporter